MKHMLGSLIILTLAFSGDALGADEAKPATPEGMVYVPPGEFIMGSEIGDADESPQHLA
ncbi:MAG: formylglycine-generating enzyme family protein, partial [Nitrospiraceae bacterium]|nr:formylglycine-generating enzyme family protein [Nitrospiraceae bacterium]